MKSKMPTLQEFKVWARENLRLAEAVMVAQANAELTRKKVDEYILPIYQSYGFIYQGAQAERFYGSARRENKMGQPLPMSDFFILHGKEVEPEIQARVRAYYEECHRAHIEHGYTVIAEREVGSCPALIAQTLYIEAQNALLESGCALMNLDSIPSTSELREKMLDLLLRSCCAESGETASQQTDRVMRRYHPKPL